MALKVGDIGWTQDREEQGLLIVKALCGWDQYQRDIYHCSIEHRTGDCEDDFIIEGDMITELRIARRFSPDELKTAKEKQSDISTKVIWLTEEQKKELRCQRPEVDEYIGYLERGEPVRWYFGG